MPQWELCSTGLVVTTSREVGVSWLVLDAVCCPPGDGLAAWPGSGAEVSLR